MNVTIAANGRPTRSYAFPNLESWAIANLHHKYFPDICRIVNTSYVETWPQQYRKPAKVSFAIFLAGLAYQKGCIDVLRAYISRTMPESLEYEKNKGGRPSYCWLNTNATDNTAQNATPPVDVDTIEEAPVIPEEDAPIVVEQVIPETPRKRYMESRRGTTATITDTHNSDAEVFKGMAHKQFAYLLNMVALNYPIWLPGPAGSGKTTAAMHTAKVLDLPFHFNGAIDTEYKLLGFTDAGGTFHKTPFYNAYKEGGLFLFDEVDASNPQALVCMNAALENGVCTFGNGEQVTRHDDLRIIAAANTYGMGATHEYVGRNKLDAATVDRFLMISWEYDEALETALANNAEWSRLVQAIRRIVKDAGIKHVVSPRASIRGAAMLAAGFTKEEALAACVFKGCTPDQVNTVRARHGASF